MSERFSFVDWNGNPRGLKNTDSLQEAIEIATEFQCEVLDTQNENQPVYSCWDGWNDDWRRQNGN